MPSRSIKVMHEIDKPEKNNLEEEIIGSMDGGGGRSWQTFRIIHNHSKKENEKYQVPL